jgi:voltage-gated sodium channel
MATPNNKLVSSAKMWSQKTIQAFDHNAQARQSRLAETRLAALNEKAQMTVDPVERERVKRVERFKAEENEHTLQAKIDHYSDLLFEVAQSKPFDNLILLVICIGFVCSALATYEAVSNSGWLPLFELMCFCAFFFEFCIKILSDGTRPWRYFTGPFKKVNCFDFIILVGCSPIMTKEWQHVAVAMRALRLFRVINVVAGHSKHVEMLVTALQAGFEELAYISVPIFIMFYIYAIMGIVFFRDNDPFHWHDLGISLTTLIRLLTLEDWTDVLYINFYGCEVYDSGMYTELNAKSGLDFFACTHPVSSPATSIFYFISFVILTVVLTAMFIGAISIALTEAVTLHMDNVQERKLEMRKVRGQVALYKQIENRSVDSWSSYDTDTTTLEEINMKLHVGAMLRQAWNGDPFSIDKFLSREEEVREKDPFWRQYWWWVKRVRRVTHSRKFGWFITLLIILTAANLGLRVNGATEYEVVDIVTQQVELVCNIVFLIELVLKIFAEGFTPWRFFFAKR